MGILRKKAGQDVLQRSGVAERPRAVGQGRHRLGGGRPLALHRVVEGGAHGPQVTRRRRGLAFELLRRRVEGGAHDASRSGGRHYGGRNGGDTEVGEDDPAAADQDVVGFEVPVNDSGPVCHGQRVQDGGTDPRDLTDRQPALVPDHRGQGPPGHELRHDRRGAVVLHHVMHSDDSRMVQAGRRQRLMRHTTQQHLELPAVQTGREQDFLDGHVTVKGLVPPPPQPAHAAPPDQLDQPIPPTDQHTASLRHDGHDRGSPTPGSGRSLLLVGPGVAG
ncbi:hypothetical protein SPW_2813 [Streptomyces sp. W007]|nr:hypothetical protein SPW_2813 [Streptomyces sp. W007]